MAKKGQEQKKKSTKNTTTATKNNVKEKVVKEKTTDKIVVEQPKKEKEEKKDQRPANEKLAKEKKRTQNIQNFEERLKQADKMTYALIAFILGIVITIIIVVIIWPDRIATLEDGTQPVATISGEIITANDLYEEMKDYYSISLLLNNIDKTILNELYEEDEEMLNEVESEAEYYYNTYESYYGYSKEEILENFGFSSEDEFYEALKLNYRRSKYTDDYITKNISDKEYEEYYKENVYGSINCQHILVATSDDVTDDDAKTKAEEIIEKLNNGSSWEDVQEEYKDDITFEDLGYQEWNANLEDSFLTALRELNENTYSKEPVKTTYGYHIIYRLDQKETPSLEDTKDDITDDLISAKKTEDEDIQIKALISLREENGLTFSDTVMEKKYKEYIEQYS